MTQHLSEYGDDDGFVIATCTCNQFGPFPAPDLETASDAFADHMRDVGQHDRDAEVAKLMFDLGLAHGSIVRLLAHGDTMAIAVDPEVHLSDPNPEWSLAAADAREILAAYIESPTAEEAPNASNRE